MLDTTLTIILLIVLASLMLVSLMSGATLAVVTHTHVELWREKKKAERESKRFYLLEKEAEWGRRHAIAKDLGEVEVAEHAASVLCLLVRERIKEEEDDPWV